MHGIGEPSSNSELGCEEDPDVLGPSSFPSSFPSFLNGTPCERNLSAGDGHPQIGEAALSGPSRLNQDLYICVCVCCMYVLQRHSLPPELHPSCFTSNKRLFFMGRIQDGCPSSRGTKESQPPPK